MSGPAGPSTRALLLTAAAVVAVVGLGTWGGIELMCTLGLDLSWVVEACAKDQAALIAQVVAACALLLAVIVVLDRRAAARRRSRRA